MSRLSLLLLLFVAVVQGQISDKARTHLSAVADSVFKDKSSSLAQVVQAA